MKQFDLIIPDIHEKIDVTDEILARWPNSRYNIFLGDYWDSFEWEHEPLHWGRVARWLCKLAQDPKNILLGGNHDVNYYLKGYELYGCSGYIPAKHRMITDIMGDQWLTHTVKWFHTVTHGDQLTVLSHAGLNVAHVGWGSLLDEAYFQRLNEEMHHKFTHCLTDPLLMAGRGRGGRGIGGVTWQDWDREFSALDVRQIVGHTPHVEPRWIGNNLCLDTHLAHVALMDTDSGEIQIEWV